MLRTNGFLDVSDIRFQACGNVCRVLVLLLGDLGLVVEALVAQGLELFARMLFAFGGGVVVAESAGRGVRRAMSKGIMYCIVLGTYAWRPRILLAFSSGARCSIFEMRLRVLVRILEECESKQGRTFNGMTPKQNDQKLRLLFVYSSARLPTCVPMWSSARTRDPVGVWRVGHNNQVMAGL